jgi:nitrate reductase gamma subunit
VSTLQVVAYVAVVFCVVATAAKMIRIACMPVHLRWDLYPIPHEKGKGSYGGSYYEEVDWWTKSRRFSLLAELKAMALEIFFVHSLFRHNRALWLVSYPFHIGLYCLVIFTLLIITGGAMVLTGVEVAPVATSGVGVALYYLTLVIGTVGWVLTTLGAVGLGLSRLFRSELRAASIRSDYFNLGFILTVGVTGIISWLTVDPEYSVLRRFVGAMLTFQKAGDVPAAVSAQVWLISALLCYFPFTHMTHMFSKFFTYHSVRWEDHPNIRGGKIEKAVNEALGRRLTWSAPHIKQGTWAEAATDRKKPDDE